MSNHNRRTSDPADTHLAFGQINNLQATAASCAIDAADDRRWFQSNPDRKERNRLASASEREAMGLPIGTMVQVVRLPDGSQARMFLRSSNLSN